MSTRPLFLLLAALALLSGPPLRAQTAAKQKALRVDLQGDPLPPGALARLGTLRFRPGRQIAKIAFTPDGTLIAALAFRGVSLWSCDTGKLVRALEGNDMGLVSTLAFAPDNKTLAVASGGVESLLHFWDWPTGKHLSHVRLEKPSRINALSFSPDGKQVVLGDESGRIRFWDRAARKEVRVFQGPDKGIQDLAFCSEGRLLAATGSKKAMLWDVATGKEVWQSEDGSDRSLVLASQGGVLAEIDDFKGKVRLRELATRKEGHFTPRQPLRGGVLSANGRMLATFLFDENGVRLSWWDSNTGRELGHCRVDPSSSQDTLLFSPDGTILAQAYEIGAIQLWDIRTGKKRLNAAGHLAQVGRVILLDDRTAVSAGADSTVRLWDVPTAGQVRAFPQGVLAADGKTVAVWEPREGIRVMETATGKLRCRRGGHRVLDSATILSDEGGTGASLEEDGLYLWDTGTGKLLRQVKTDGFLQDRFSASMTQLQFSADGQVLLARSHNPRKRLSYNVRVWQTATGKLLWFLDDVPVLEITLSPDGRMVAMLGYNGKADGSKSVLLCEAATGKPLHQLPLKTAPLPEWVFTPMSAPTFSPDNRLLACAADDGSLHVFTTTTGKLLRRLEDHHNGIKAGLFSADSRTIAAVNEDRSIRLWEMASGKERCFFPGHARPINALSFSATGRTLASGSNDTTVLVWDATGLSAKKAALSKEQLEAAWTDLASSDAARAGHAVWLLADADQAVPFLRQKLGPVTALDADRLKQLVRDLESEEYRVRQKADEELDRLRELAEPALRHGLEGQPSLETRQRIERLLARIDRHIFTPEQLRTVRAMEALEHAGTVQARQVLRRLAGGTPAAWLTQEAKAAVDRMARPPQPASLTIHVPVWE